MSLNSFYFQSIESLPKRKGQFDFNRLGPPRGAMRPSSALELKKVPRGLNTIEHLNNHFSRFGKIVNIQVCSYYMIFNRFLC